MSEITIQQMQKTCSLQNFLFIVTNCDNNYFSFCTRCGTKTGITIFTVSIKVNSKDDTFSEIGCTSEIRRSFGDMSN
jgi:hypothetical protein